MSKLDEVLDRHWQELRKRKGVLNVSVGNKFKDGKDTGRKAIVVYVAEKKPLNALAALEVIPSEIEGCETDVVELSTKDYVLGDTEPSKKSPKIQRRIAGGVRKE